MSKVPFRDRQRDLERSRDTWRRAVLQAIDSCDFGRPNGQIRAFEEAWAEYCGVEHAVATSSGSTALFLCYWAYQLDHASEIVSVANTFVATLEAALMLGARPVLVDIRADYSLDPEQLEAAITDRTRLLVPFHPFGRLADMEKIRAVARRHSLAVVEEACQAHGAERDGVRAGAFGDAAVFSFGPTKPLAGIGEGGAVVTNDAALADTMRKLINHGRQNGEHVVNGLNFRMHPIEAAFLRSRLPQLPEFLDERRAIASRYTRAFADLDIVANPAPPGAREHSYYLYVVEVENRDRFVEYLESKGIGWAIHYPVPVHRQPAHVERFAGTRLPVTDHIQERMVSLPMINGLTEAEIDEVIGRVREGVEVASVAA